MDFYIRNAINVRRRLSSIVTFTRRSPKELRKYQSFFLSKEEVLVEIIFFEEMHGFQREVLDSFLLLYSEIQEN